jgi:hypothetical protein
MVKHHGKEEGKEWRCQRSARATHGSSRSRRCDCWRAAARAATILRGNWASAAGRSTAGAHNWLRKARARGSGHSLETGELRMRSWFNCAGRTRIRGRNGTSCEKQWPSSRDPRDEVPLHGATPGCPLRGEDGRGAGRDTQWGHGAAGGKVDVKWPTGS